MSDSVVKAPGAQAEAPAMRGKVPATRRDASSTDLVVNRAGADYKAIEDAHAKGERVSTKGMTREEVIKLITG